LDDPAPPWSVRVKRESIAAISRALPPASAALLAGLLLGDHTDLPRDVDDAFRRAGVYHVLAVSGFNVGILAASVWALCRLLRVPHRASAATAIVVVIGFALVVGPEPSVLRAVVMAVLVLVATLLARDASVPQRLVAVALSFLSEALAAVAFDAVWPILLALRGVVALAARVPDAVVHLPAPGWIAVACYVAGLTLLLAWRESRRPGVLLPGALLLAVAVGGAAWPLVRPADGRLRLTILDVGQGDAIVVEIPDGRALLVDSGSGGPMRLDAGERVVAPFLWNRGILRLVAMAVTHDDSDHAGGAASVRRLFSIDEEWLAASLPLVPRRFGRVEITPLPPPAVTGRRRNESALVLRLGMGRVSFLLASDIGASR